MSDFVVHCAKCSHEWVAAYLPMEIGTFVKVAKAATCPKCGASGKSILCGRKKPAASPEELTPLQWVMGPDTGISSMTIYAVMMGAGTPAHTGFPHDPDDFGRCHRLLKSFPEWRKRLPELATTYGGSWAALVEHWDELATLYEAGPDGVTKDGRYPVMRKLYDRLQELIYSKARI